MPKNETNKQTSKKMRVTIFADDIARKGLEPLIMRENLLDFCDFEPHKENVIILRFDKQEMLFTLPVRIGKVIDQITFFSKKAQSRNAAILELGHGVLDIALGNFIPLEKNTSRKNKKNKENAPIPLTEKEVKILSYLHSNAERKVPRDELLETVWGYAKGTETHTLETHIYRLRQKIETDPSSPQILKKDEEGYYIGQIISGN